MNLISSSQDWSPMACTRESRYRKSNTTVGHARRNVGNSYMCTAAYGIHELKNYLWLSIAMQVVGLCRSRERRGPSSCAKFPSSYIVMPLLSGSAVVNFLCTLIRSASPDWLCNRCLGQQGNLSIRVRQAFLGFLLPWWDTGGHVKGVLKDMLPNQCIF